MFSEVAEIALIAARLGQFLNFTRTHAITSHAHHRFTLSFARNFIKVTLGKKTWQVESVEHIEQYHINFGDKSHNLKQRGRKAFVELLFSWS